MKYNILPRKEFFSARPPPLKKTFLVLLKGHEILWNDHEILIQLLVSVYLMILRSIKLIIVQFCFINATSWAGDFWPRHKYLVQTLFLLWIKTVFQLNLSSIWYLRKLGGGEEGSYEITGLFCAFFTLSFHDLIKPIHSLQIKFDSEGIGSPHKIFSIGNPQFLAFRLSYDKTFKVYGGKFLFMVTDIQKKKSCAFV